MQNSVSGTRSSEDHSPRGLDHSAKSYEGVHGHGHQRKRQPQRSEHGQAELEGGPRGIITRHQTFARASRPTRYTTSPAETSHAAKAPTTADSRPRVPAGARVPPRAVRAVRSSSQSPPLAARAAKKAATARPMAQARREVSAAS